MVSYGLERGADCIELFSDLQRGLKVPTVSSKSTRPSTKHTLISTPTAEKIAFPGENV